VGQTRGVPINDMKKVVGVRFKPAGKVYDFDAGAFVLKIGDAVIVETAQGLGFGVVARATERLKAEGFDKPLKKVFRLANEKDLRQREKNSATELRAYRFCLGCIRKLGLKMNLFSVESTFDAGKLTFYFTADGRVDFRQLVKMLARELGVRVEMRQVGIRNQAKLCGGAARCGRQTCCSTFMEKFIPVSIRMAKEQGLSLNPTKISGQCGRLMCCLTFEYDTYRELRGKLPRIGRKIDTPMGRGRVVRQNALQRRITVRLDKGEEVEIDTETMMQTDSGEMHG